jgi:hypothetical protein
MAQQASSPEASDDGVQDVSAATLAAGANSGKKAKTNAK